MYGTLLSQLRAHFVSICPRHVDQLTIAVAAIVGLGLLTLVRLGSQRTIAEVRQPPIFVIDPNTGSKAELLLLPRVGPSLASAILKEREIQAFESAEDISRTRGIGEKTLLKLLPHLRVTEESSR